MLAGGLVLALAVAGGWFLGLAAPRRALLKLTPAERTDLFQRTRAQAEALCGRHQAAFEEECRHELEFLKIFPECDVDCQQFARSYLVHPVR